MTLYTGHIYTNHHLGTKISVMSRHTLKDGHTPDPQITADSFDEWWMELSPPPRLVAEWYHYNLPWKKFEKGYIRYLRQSIAKYVVKNLALAALKDNFTLLCVEPSPEYCHRRILVQECRRRVSSLEIVVR